MPEYPLSNAMNVLKLFLFDQADRSQSVQLKAKMTPRHKDLTDDETSKMTKKLKVPCLVKYEKLKESYPDLQIYRCGTLYSKQPERKSIAPNLKARSTGRFITSNKTRDNRGRNGQSRKIRFVKGLVNNSSDVYNSISKSDDNSSDATSGSGAHARPETIDSRQSLPSHNKRCTNKLSNGIQGAQNRSNPQNKKLEIFHTNDMVDEAILCSIDEIAQRANITPTPSEPIEVCIGFSVFLADINLNYSDTPPHDPDDERLTQWKARALNGI